MGVERGPGPHYAEPWHRRDELLYSGGEVMSIEVAEANFIEDATTICHRVNNWDELVAERDALAARVAELGAELAYVMSECADARDRLGHKSEEAERRHGARMDAAIQRLEESFAPLLENERKRVARVEAERDAALARIAKAGVGVQASPTIERCRRCGLEWLCPDCDGQGPDGH